MRYFANGTMCSGDYTIPLTAGATIDLTSLGTTSTSFSHPINLSKLDIPDSTSGSQTHLTFLGGVSAGVTTTIIADPTQTPIYSNSGTAGYASHIKFESIIFALATPELSSTVTGTSSATVAGTVNASGQAFTYWSTQGTAATGTLGYAGSSGGSQVGWLDIDIQPNFPNPFDLFDSANELNAGLGGTISTLLAEGRFLRLYDNSTPTNPQVLETAQVSGVATDETANNAQVVWGSIENPSSSYTLTEPGSTTAVPACTTSNYTSAAVSPCYYMVSDGANDFWLVKPFRQNPTTYPNRWTFLVRSGGPSAPITTFASLIQTLTTNGASYLIGVKSKADVANTYNFQYQSGSGSLLQSGAPHDLLFSGVTWEGRTRGVFDGGSFGIGLVNVSLPRPPAICTASSSYATSTSITSCSVSGAVTQALALSSSGGGPQIGDVGEPQTAGNYVTGFKAQSTGDDSLAIFNDVSNNSTLASCTSNSVSSATLCASSVSTSTISNSFVRSILLYSNDTTGSLSLASNVYVADPDTSSHLSGTLQSSNASTYTQAVGLADVGNTIVTGNGGTLACDAFASSYESSSPSQSTLLYPQDNSGSLYIPTPICGILYEDDAP